MSAETNRYMNSTRIRKTLYVAFFVSVAAQIHVDFLTGGFIVTISRMPVIRNLLSVEDTGPGIAPEELDNLFLAGYSTKFDPRTGNIQWDMGAVCGYATDPASREEGPYQCGDHCPGGFRQCFFWCEFR